MKSNSNENSLILRYFDGTLTKAELEAFNQRLKQDAEFRAEFREVAEQAIGLGDMGRSREFSRSQSPAIKENTSAGRGGFGYQFLAAAAVLIFALGVIYWLVGDPAAEPIATLEIADGAVVWTGVDGRPIAEPKAGMALGPGTLTVESSTGLVQFRYVDSTVVTVSGESEIQLSAPDGWKRVVLRRGHLTAEVTAQPADKPFTVTTDTAEIEVLGTVLSIGSSEEETDLIVDSGKVKMRRLADGQRLDVPAGNRVVASLDTRKPLELTEENPLASSWALNLSSREGNRVTKGLLRRGQERAFLKAEPYWAGKTPNGTKVVRQGIAINGPQGFGSPFVDLTAESRVFLRYRSTGTVTLFFSTRNPEGRFGGNYECKIDRPVEDGSLGEWREVEFPISDFRLVEGLRSRQWKYGLEECEVNKVLISVIERGDLEVESVAIR